MLIDAPRIPRVIAPEVCPRVPNRSTIPPTACSQSLWVLWDSLDRSILGGYGFAGSTRGCGGLSQRKTASGAEDDLPHPYGR